MSQARLVDWVTSSDGSDSGIMAVHEGRWL